jgi:hypothetical protein
MMGFLLTILATIVIVGTIINWMKERSEKIED